MATESLKIYYKKGRPFFPSGYYLVTWDPYVSVHLTLMHVYVRKQRCFYSYTDSAQPEKIIRKKVTKFTSIRIIRRDITKINKAQYNMLLHVWRNKL